MPESGRDAVSLAVVEASQVGEARRLASDVAGKLRFDPVGQGKVALIVTELGNNLVRHARQGELFIQPIRSCGRLGIDVLAIDRGPGVADFRRCLADGYSTAGTPGTGLGAVVRIADDFDVHSVPNKGTVIGTRVWNAGRGVADRGKARTGLDLGAVCLPLAGETACGDAWGIEEPNFGQTTCLIVADGLGHGPKAAEASLAAVKTFRKNPHLGPGDHLAAIHMALKGTRGAAVAVALILHDRRELRFAGVGNIAGAVFDHEGRQHGMVSHNGTVGGNMHKVQEFTHGWPEGALLVLYSDGLATQWRLNDQPILKAKAPGVIAGTLYRDYSRGRDDVTVVVARDRSATSL